MSVGAQNFTLDGDRSTIVVPTFVEKPVKTIALSDSGPGAKSFTAVLS